MTTILSTFKLRTFALAVAASVTFASCSDDKDKDPSYNVPQTYNFENVNYSGQTTRMDMLTALDTYIKTGTEGKGLSAQNMKNMYANVNSPFANSDLNTSGKQLKNKTILTAQAEFESYFDAVAAASNAVSTVAGLPAQDGRAGLLTTTEGKKYLVDANGVEYGQVISKGLMGAVFYYQAVDHYLTEEQIGAGVDNKMVTAGEGTAMQHHWDEAFGYFGAPKDFPTNLNGLQFWANYSNKVNAVLGSNKAMMDAFLKGRAAINANDTKGKEEAIATLRTEWERLVVASAIHELNAAKTNIADQAKKSHYLSEARGFVMGLKFKSDRKLTNAQYDNVMAKIGANYYNTTAADINAAIDILSEAYSMSSIKGQL